MRTAHPVTKKDSKQIISDDKNWDTCIGVVTGSGGGGGGREGGRGGSHFILWTLFKPNFYFKDNYRRLGGGGKQGGVKGQNPGILLLISNLHRSPWRSDAEGGLSILRVSVLVQETAFFFFFFIVFFFFFLFFFSLLLLQCDFNINLMPYSVSPTFFTPYDAQASSACRALILKEC